MNPFGPALFGDIPAVAGVTPALVRVGDDSAAVANQRAVDDPPEGPPDSKYSKHTLNFAVVIPTVIVSSIVFLIIFTWYDLLVAMFASTFGDSQTPATESVTIHLWFAIFMTALGLVLLYIIYRAIRG